MLPEDNNIEQQNEEQFIVDNFQKVNWCLRKINEIQKEIQNNNDIAQVEIERLQKEIERIEIWRDDVNKTPNGEIEFFKQKIYPFVKEYLDNNNKRSMKLPYGKIALKAKSNIERNDDELFNYVKANYPNYILEKKSETVMLNDFKKFCTLDKESGQLVTPDGEIVPGYRVEFYEDYSVDGNDIVTEE